MSSWEWVVGINLYGVIHAIRQGVLVPVGSNREAKARASEAGSSTA